MPRRGVAVLVLLGVSLTTGACVRFPATMAVYPASLFVQQICPGARYEVVGDFADSWTRWGFLGFPIGGPPDVIEFVDAEVARLRGDASMDVKVYSDFRLYYMVLGAIIISRHQVTGKVIRYTVTTCEVR